MAVCARMGAYEILSPLGAGGMGEVYRARDTRLDREVALKLISVSKAQDQTARDRIELQLRLVLGVPFTSLEFDGLPTATCIDTGAKLSYLERGRLARTEVVGEADDFYPGLGAFRTAIHDVPVRIATSTLTLRIGELPDALAVQLSMLGLAAILGTEILDHFPKVTFDYPASVARLHLKPVPPAVRPGPAVLR